jgi:hypothetical protein
LRTRTAAAAMTIAATQASKNDFMARTPGDQPSAEELYKRHGAENKTR